LGQLRGEIKFTTYFFGNIFDVMNPDWHDSQLEFDWKYIDRFP